MRNKREVIDWARDHLKKNDFLIMDFETTGLPPDKKNPHRVKPEAVSVALLDSFGTPILNTYLKPVSATIEPEAEAVHHITAAMIDNAPSFKLLYDALKRWSKGRTIIVYNEWFENSILRYGYEYNGLEPLDLDIECAMQAYAAYREVSGQYGYRKNFKLTEAVKHEIPEMDVQDAHGALADARLTLVLLKAMSGSSGDQKMFIESAQYFNKSIGEVIKKAVRRAAELQAAVVIDDRPTACNDFTMNECGRYWVPCQTWGYQSERLGDSYLSEFWQGQRRLRGFKDQDHFAAVGNHIAIPIINGRDSYMLGSLVDAPAKIVICFTPISTVYTTATTIGLKPILYDEAGKLLKTRVDYVYNVNLNDPDVVYIGRAQKNPSHPKMATGFWGNPFSKTDPAVGTKERAIELFRDWIVQQPDKMARLEELRGKRIVCWCKKQGHEGCHGDVYVELLEGV